MTEARFDARDSLILAGAPFDPVQLQRDYPQRFKRERVVRMNANDVVEAFEEMHFDAIVLERRAVAVNADDALRGLLSVIRTRGIAALPRWAVQPYLEKDYVAEMPITSKGLRASLHAATTREGAAQAFMKEFIETVRLTAKKQFEGIRLL